MKILTIAFLYIGVLACCCTTTPLTVTPVPTENRQIDSCEVFLRKLRANMGFSLGPAGRPRYSIRGEWAKKSRKYPRLWNMEADFYDYKNCLIGLTATEAKDLLGEPTSARASGRYRYFYIRRDTSSVRTATMLREGDIIISSSSHGTIREVAISHQQIDIR